MKYNLPGQYLTSRNRYAQMLADTPNTNNGTVPGGLAHVLRNAMMGFMMGRDSRDQRQADQLMAQGMMAKPWMNPDTGTPTIPEQMPPGMYGPPRMAPTAPAGGMEGALSALSKAPENEYAGRLSRDLMMNQVGRQQDMQDAIQKMQLKAQFDPGVQEKFGNNPIWAVGPEGKPALFQTGSQGGLNPVRIPEGYTPINGRPIELRRGNTITLLDPLTREPISSYEVGVPPQDDPKLRGRQAAAAAAGTEFGKDAAKAKIDLPQLEADAEYSINLIDAALGHPGLPDVVGMPSAAGALNMRGTEAANFRVLLNQMQGRQFMQAYVSLKGGGVITEIEGEKATQALARMSEAQTEEAFKEGLREFRAILDAGIKRARARAGGSAAGASTQPAAPAIQEYDYIPGQGFVARGGK